LWFNSKLGQENLAAVQSMQTRPGTIQHPTKWVARALSPRVEGLGHEVDNVPSSSAKGKQLYIHSPIGLCGVLLNP
jgi:hypothetical protein